MVRNVVCVLRSGGDFDAEDATRLVFDVGRHLPDAQVYCLSDLGDFRTPLHFAWPGWWSKLEMFRPDIVDALGEFLFLDLDVIARGDLSDIFAVKGPAIMGDVYRKGGLQSAVMKIDPPTARRIWSAWSIDPLAQMRRFEKGGDQAFIESLGLKWRIFQRELPGQVISYKAHIRDAGGRTPADSRLVVFHGKPRPRELGWRLPDGA